MISIKCAIHHITLITHNTHRVLSIIKVIETTISPINYTLNCIYDVIGVILLINESLLSRESLNLSTHITGNIKMIDNENYEFFSGLMTTLQTLLLLIDPCQCSTIEI